MSLPSMKEIGYLIGLLEGDGYLFHDRKSRHYNIEFYLNSLKDLDIQEFLVKILNKMSFKPYILKDKRFNCNKIRVYSKSFFEFCNTMRRNNKVSKNFKIGFISGLIDADGYVSNKSHIEIINTNKKLMLKVRKFLKSINIKVKIKLRIRSKKDKLPSYRIYVPLTFIKVKNLSLKISRNKQREAIIAR